MKTEFDYIHFVEKAHLGVTTVWHCFNGHHDLLGIVKWNPHWRQYCYFIESSLKDEFIVFSSGCLTDIVSFLTQVNELHKLDLIKRKKEANNE